MGDTCSACQAHSNQQEIKTVALGQNKQNTPQPAAIDSEKVCTSEEGMKKSKQSAGSAKRANPKEDSVRASLKGEKKNSIVKEAKHEHHSDDELAVEEKKDDKPMDMHSLVSQPHSPVKSAREGVKLEKMPDYFNPLTKEKLQKLQKFQYDRPQYEVEGAIQQSPIQFDSKYVYEGQWKDGQKAGRGRQLWRDGSYYEGYWLNNMANGYGRLIHTDGDIYQGEWTEDRAQGYGIFPVNVGVYSHVCGAVFKGKWKNDKQEGYGEEVWPDNAVYKGEYCSGKKHGKGRFEWSDNSCYEGEFLDNNISGYGKYKWRDGRIFQGTWQLNKMEGKGLFTWPDGRKYEGEYKNDKKHGFGVFYWPDGRIYRGQWSDGKQHGKGEYKSKRGSVREGVWENGVRIKWLNEDGSKGTTTNSSQA